MLTKSFLKKVKLSAPTPEPPGLYFCGWGWLQATTADFHHPLGSSQPQATEGGEDKGGKDRDCCGPGANDRRPLPLLAWLAAGQRAGGNSNPPAQLMLAWESRPCSTWTSLQGWMCDFLRDQHPGLQTQDMWWGRGGTTKLRKPFLSCG